MLKRYPADRTSLPLSLDVYNQLQWASFSTGNQKEDWEIATEAIDEWLRRHDPNSLPGPAHAGYQWKRLFLPDGTVLRTVFGGKNHHCLVDGDRLVYEKRAVSPSGFVNAVGGVRRNAWKSTWILFPDSKDWKLADSLRSKEHRGRARSIASAVKPVPSRDNAHAPLDAPPVPAERAVVQPSAGSPASVPRRARRGRLALAAFMARHTRHAVHDHMHPASDSANQQPQPGFEKKLAPDRFGDGHECRVMDDERMAALVRHELLPLLSRLAAIDAHKTAGIANNSSRMSGQRRLSDRS
jgi:hypothetical protein